MLKIPLVQISTCCLNNRESLFLCNEVGTRGLGVLVTTICLSPTCLLVVK